MATDFTNPDVFAGYLSTFWTQIFAGSEAIRGMVDGQSAQLSQLSEDFGQLVRSASVATADALRHENVRPIFIRRSRIGVGPDVLQFGDGANYGAQGEASPLPSGSTPGYGTPQRRETAFYHVLPAGVADPGQTILSGLYEPALVWVAGADYEFEPLTRILSFASDPFADPRLARRVVAAADNETPDEEIVLFGVGAKLQAGDLQRRWGYPFFSRPPVELDADGYRQLLAAIVRLFSGGATVAALDSFFAAAAGLPVILEPRETITSTAPLGEDTMVLTDHNVYRLPAGHHLRSNILGVELRAGQPLSDATRVFDRRARPDWWTTVPGLTLGRDFLGPDLAGLRSLSFPNAEATVDPDGGRGGRFPVLGRKADVDAFWAHATTKAGSNTALADLLWRDGNVVHADGSADFDRPLPVNPWGWVFDRFLADGLIGVELSVVPNDALLLSLGVLRDVLPVGCALAVFVTPVFNDDHALTVDPASGITEPSVSVDDDFATQFFGAPFSASAELDAVLPVTAVIGRETIGQLLDEVIDFGDPSLIKHDVWPVDFPVCN